MVYISTRIIINICYIVSDFKFLKNQTCVWVCFCFIYFANVDLCWSDKELHLFSFVFGLPSFGIFLSMLANSLFRYLNFFVYKYWRLCIL